MGCTQSKIENEEAVTRCKDRKQFMKEAVSSRNAFAAAHSAYAICLKNTGAALSDYTQGEFSHHPAAAAAAAVQSVADTPSSMEIPPPPPPLPNFQNPVPLQRAASMPEIKTKIESKPVAPTIMEDEELEFEAQDSEKLIRKRSSSSNRGNISSRQENHHPYDHPEQTPQQQPPPQPWKEEAMGGSTMHQGMSWGEYIFEQPETMRGLSLAEPEVVEELNRREFVEKANRAPIEKVPEPEPEPEPVLEVEEKGEKTVELPVPVPMPVVEKKVVKKGGEMGRRGAKPVSLMQIFADLDDHFLKASESAHEVSKMLEATRLHYHSNFADNRGHIDHSKRVMRVITWNRSFKGMPSLDDGKDDFDTEENETHATVLDKMLAWEKKLYDEVKAGEIMKYEYQKKVALLNNKKKRGANPESLEKLKAAVSHLHTRYIVDMQSMDSTVAEINRLRDEQLYPKLVQLVDGMATMWETMRYHHETQSKIVYALKSLENSEVVRETSEYHYDRTIQLCGVVRDWHTQFCRLIDYQKEYIRALNHWLKLNLVPIESNLKEKVSSPPRVQNPPIHLLLVAWNDDLEKLPDEVARSAISNFAAVIQTLVHNQDEEIKMREKCEATRRELERKGRQYQEWCMKNGVVEELEPDNPLKIAKDERESAVISLRQQLEEDEEECRKICRQVREKSLTSLKHRLPELFRAMSEIAKACSGMYSNLRSIAENQ